jgi:hypothetical protein
VLILKYTRIERYWERDVQIWCYIKISHRSGAELSW